MRVLYWILGLGFGVGLMSCDTKTEPDLGNWSTVVVEPVDDATFLFDGSILRTYELRVSDENLAFLNDDPVAEAYVSATLDFEGETFTDVGLRYKGSIGAFVGCTEQNGFPPQETKTCVKLSMKVKMDFTEDGGNFFGLRKLQFHSMNSDQSLMRERLGYALFREMGVTSPRTAPVRLVINGEFAGLFLLVEQIDRSFTRARFGDGGEGNIYKEIWPVHNQQELYATALRNKGGVDRSVERIQRFAQNLLDASENELSTLSERWIHHETIMRYLAVDRTIGNDDGIMHWYCGIPEAQGANASACGNHNFYWYEESKQDHLWLIPWDLDLILGGNTFTLLPAPWYSETNSCEEVVSSFSSRLAWCDPLIRSWTMSMSDFDAVVNDFLEGPFSVGSVETKLATWESQIAPYVEEAFDSNSKHLSVADWQDGLAELRWQIEMHRSRAEMPR